VIAKSFFRRALVSAARRKTGERTLNALAVDEPQLLFEALGRGLNLNTRLRNVTVWPETLGGFEDVSFLFAATQLNHGVISMAIDEAAYLFRLAHTLGPATLVEIGRYKGGSTLLLAAAMDSGATLYSYDLHTKQTSQYDYGELDEETGAALERYGLADRVHLVVGDSKAVEPPALDCALVFVDGDHTYAGVRGDYENWRRAIRPGGHLLFHDAAAFRDLTVLDEQVARLMDEIKRDDGEYFQPVGGAGALLHFVRTETTAPWDRPEAQ
jgi:predicted O-methyltransferase YrrM